MKQSFISGIRRARLLTAAFGLTLTGLAQVSITNNPTSITPQSMLHIHSNSASGQIFQLTNTTSGYTLPTYGFAIKLDPNFKTVFANQYNNSNASISFTTNNGSDVERLTIKNNGFIGINNINPLHSLDITGDLLVYYGTGSSYGLIVSGSTSSSMGIIHNNYAGNADAFTAGCYSDFAGTSSRGIYGFNNGSGTAVYGLNVPSTNYGYMGSLNYGVYGSFGTSSNGLLGSSGYGVYGKWNSTNNYGYLGSASYGVYGNHGPTSNYGYIGGSDYAVYGSYGSSGTQGYLGGLNNAVYGINPSTAAGDFAIFGFGSTSYGAVGMNYSWGAIGGVRGYASYGNNYTFGVQGLSWLDFSRSGAVFGGAQTGSAPWGCLGYKNSAGTMYGGYFTSSTSGGGKSSDVKINSGISSWGDLFGADIHGKIYGLYTEGSEYASFANGSIIRNGMDIHLQKEETGKEVALYTHVSTDMTVQTAGYATLSGGVCQVEFESSFLAVVSDKSPVIVTITPMGNTSGVYLSEVSGSGFHAVENNDGRSNVKISYIAIGKRKGYENPSLPQSVISGDYVSKVSEGLHNDASTDSAGKGLYYENGELHTGIHPSTRPDQSRTATDPLLRSQMK